MCDGQTGQRVCFLTREPRQNPGWMKSLLYLSQLLDSNWAPPCNICQNNP